MKVAPSILSADFARLAEECRRCEAAGADWIHVDVMDGHFVPNLTLGPVVVESLRKATPLFLDTHLMVSDPLEYGRRFAEAGSDRITFHLEAVEDAEKVAKELAKTGKRVGISINPGREPEDVFPLLEHVDLVLVMSVWAGFGGQSFMPESIGRVERISSEIRRRGLAVELQVDGGINAETGKLVREAGATSLVAGTYLFRAPDMAGAIAALRV